MLPHRVLIAVTVILLAIGWHRTWPDLNRDLNHLHGWASCQDAHMARMFAEEGALRTGLRPVEYRLFDAADSYRYAHYGILTTAIVSLVYEVASPAWEHRALRLAGMLTTCTFLLGLFLLARRLADECFASWALFFGAISPQVFFFGAFPASYVIGNTFAVMAFLAYVGWRRGGNRWQLAACVGLLTGAHLSSVYLVGASVAIGLDIALNRTLPDRRRVWGATAFALLPLVLIGVQELHYRHGVEWITGHAPWGSDVAQNVAQRMHLELLGTIDLYKRLVDDLTWRLSPVALVSFVVFLAIDAPRAIRRWRAGSPEIGTWRSLFVFGTLGLAAIVVPFPQSTLTHDFTFTVLLVPMSLMAARLLSRTRSAVAACAVVILTSLGAFAGTRQFKNVNNSSSAEWQLGVALRLATPRDAIVRLPWDGAESFFMLQYYAHRALLPDVPEPYRAVGLPEPRFVVGAPPIPDAAAAIHVPGMHGSIIDLHPGERPSLPIGVETYRRGAWELVSRGITGRYGGLAIVELDWILHRAEGAPPSIEIGQRVRGKWARLGVFRLRGNAMESWPSPDGVPHRDGYVVPLAGAGPILLRIIDEGTGMRLAADSGRLEIYVEDIPGVTQELRE